jgi:cardiolipin synthase
MLDKEPKKFFTPSTADIGNVGIQIAASGPESSNDEIEFALLKMLGNAQKYVYIQTPYFVPDNAFLTAVRIAAQSGIDVRIMLPGVPDKMYVYYVTTSYIGELLESGARVYLYNGFIHSKTVVIDDSVSTIGTTNIDIRSFQLHFEINAFLYDLKTASECRQIFENDILSCREITMSEYKARGIGQIMKEGFFRLFSPIM